MLAMQAFHDLLFSESNDLKGYLQILARLTQTGLSQIKAFESDITWTIWNEEHSA
jgi:hypothetical protein